MVKALAESGLAEYEPYSGVRLTSSGTKLAVLVLRRHRLVELFLVQVMGISWAEVHDEAEQLEHVVSERLIERMDEMLGRPTHDPHGDPIPTAEGTVHPAGGRQPAHLSRRHTAPRRAHRRSGSGLPAVHRASRAEAGAAGGGRAPRSGRRRGAAARLPTGARSPSACGPRPSCWWKPTSTPRRSTPPPASRPTNPDQRPRAQARFESPGAPTAAVAGGKPPGRTLSPPSAGTVTRLAVRSPLPPRRRQARSRA